MRVAAVSDIHAVLPDPKEVPDCDVLVIAGDYCPNFTYHQHMTNPRDADRQLAWLQGVFTSWAAAINCEEIVVISGNHDWVHWEPATKREARETLRSANLIYLEDTAWEYRGVKFYGSPWTPYFHAWAFNFPQNPARARIASQHAWSKIPTGTDVLITHGPPYEILDRTREGNVVGCPYLSEAIIRVRPKLHVFGHIHEGYGQVELNGTTFANVSWVTRDMDSGNPIRVFDVPTPDVST